MKQAANNARQLLGRLFPRRSRATVIQSPTLGIFDLSAGSSSTEAGADRAAVEPLFSAVHESSTTPPACSTLFIYCHVELDGTIRNSDWSLREIIRDSGAAVVVVATENPWAGYLAAVTNKPGYGRANLVLTLRRRGDVFPAFFRRLFIHMNQGLTMPLAWVKLAPQIPGVERADCPGCIFVCETRTRSVFTPVKPWEALGPFGRVMRILRIGLGGCLTAAALAAGAFIIPLAFRSQSLSELAAWLFEIGVLLLFATGVFRFLVWPPVFRGQSAACFLQ